MQIIKTTITPKEKSKILGLNSSKYWAGVLAVFAYTLLSNSIVRAYREPLGEFNISYPLYVVKYWAGVLAVFTYTLLSNSIVHAYRKPLGEFNISYPQYVVMMALWEQDGITIAELVAAAVIDGVAMTQILKNCR